MAPLPVISGVKVVRAFEKAGWRQDRQRGSHVVMLKPGCNVSLSVPRHHKNCARYASRVDPFGGHDRR